MVENNDNHQYYETELVMLIIILILLTCIGYLFSFLFGILFHKVFILKAPSKKAEEQEAPQLNMI